MTKEQKDFFDSQCVKYSRELLNAAYRRTGDYHYAQDAVQMVFLVMVRKIDYLYLGRDKVNIRFWLLKTLYNVIGNELKRRKRITVGLSDDELSTDFLLSRISRNDNLNEALPSGLTDDEREILFFRIQDELPYTYIAEITGLTEAALRKRMERALNHCKELLEKNSENLKSVSQKRLDRKYLL